MSEWKTYQLGEILEITSSKRIFAHDYVSTGVPFYRSKEIIEKAGGLVDITTELFISEEKFSEISNRFGAPISGDILLSSVGTLGVSYRVKAGERFYFKDGNLTWFRNFSEHVDSHFLVQWLRCAATQSLIDSIAIGTTQRALTIAGLKKLAISLPSIAEQRAIAHVLGTLDDKIALNRQINQTLEHIAQAMFKSWFVDFEPVKAKMAAITAGENQHGISRAAMRAISGKTDDELNKQQSKHPDRYQELQSVAELFPDSMNATGEIPSGWSESIIGDEVSIVGGGTPSTACPEYWNGEFAWVTPKDLSGVTEKILIDSERKITQAGVKKISSGQLPIGSVLLSSRAPIGYLALTMIPVSINQGFIAMVCDKQLPNTYVLQWAEKNLEDIKQRGSGTTFAELSKTAFRTMKIIKPNALLLDAFNRQALPLYEKMAALVFESKSLSRIRDVLLPKLLSGEIVLEAGEEKNG